MLVDGDGNEVNEVNTCPLLVKLVLSNKKKAPKKKTTASKTPRNVQ